MLLRSRHRAGFIPGSLQLGNAGKCSRSSHGSVSEEGFWVLNVLPSCKGCTELEIHPFPSFILPFPSFPHPCSPLPPKFSFPAYFLSPATETFLCLRDNPFQFLGWDPWDGIHGIHGITVWGWICGSQRLVLPLSQENHSEIVPALDFLLQALGKAPRFCSSRSCCPLKLRDQLWAGIPLAPQEIFPESSHIFAVLGIKSHQDSSILLFQTPNPCQLQHSKSTEPLVLPWRCHGGTGRDGIPNVGMEPGILSFRNPWKRCGKAGSGPGRGAEGAVEFIWDTKEAGELFWFLPVMRKAKPQMCGCLWSVLEDSSLIQAGIPGCLPSLQWGGLNRPGMILSVFL